MIGPAADENVRGSAAASFTSLDRVSIQYCGKTRWSGISRR